MTHDLDAIVIGAGPAGAQAAITAARYGCRVALLDEQPSAGGQVWRAPVGSFAGKRDADARSGDRLRASLSASAVQTYFGHRVWSVIEDARSPDSQFRVDALGASGNCAFTAPALVIATGAHERVVPFPGWTLPGVVGLAAATILLKSHGVAPGSRIIVAGCGPLLAVVAAGLTMAGVRVLAVADMARTADWLMRLPAILARPSLALRGAAWSARAALSGVPLMAGHGVRRAEGVEAVSKVILGPVNASGEPLDGPERTYEVDALIVGHGLTTACEITRLLRARHRYNHLHGGWQPVVDKAFQTSVPGLFAVGDGAGVRGQQLASLAGMRVGTVLASNPGGMSRQSAAADLARIDRAISRATPFSDAMAGLMAQRIGQVTSIKSDTIVCRCEDITRIEIDCAIEAGATQIDQLKHFTRCGMGPCQGRYCGDTVQALMAHKLGQSREAIGQWTGRPPLRPVILEELVGEFSYDDIPIPPPAPL